jgi:dTDP-4-dehydrorhamnose 3,5-epimerase
MIFRELGLAGAYLIEIERHTDERGFFARTWCKREFANQNLETEYVQASISVNATRGTVRGLHYQCSPHWEVKVVQCIRGAIYDVIVDLRPGSETFRKCLGVTLSAASHDMLYIPAGFAHGFQTLEDDTEVSYLISAFYVAAAARGIRYDDPALGINWPMKVTRISEKDRGLPGIDDIAELATAAETQSR